MVQFPVVELFFSLLLSLLYWGVKRESAAERESLIYHSAAVVEACDTSDTFAPRIVTQSIFRLAKKKK